MLLSSKIDLFTTLQILLSKYSKAWKLPQINNKEVKKHLFIHGLGGIGKSVSASLLVVLHNFIDKIRTTTPKSDWTVLEDK